MYIEGILILLILALIVAKSGILERPKVVQAPTVAIPRPSYGVKENFESYGGLPIGGGDSPALDAPRTPYTLLGDALPPLQLGEKHEVMTAQRAWELDYNAQSSLVGNHRKTTNNNMMTYPDTWTSPRQEFILGFYKEPATVQAPVN
jgi:hypothetical protein